LSYEVESVPSTDKSERQYYRVRYWLSPPAAGTELSQPVIVAGKGWETGAASPTTAGGEIEISGTPDHLDNVVKLSVGALSQDLHLPAPWLVTSGILRPFWNGQNQTYDAAKARGPMQNAIAKNRDFIAASGSHWQRYFASVNFTGGNAPGNVDFAAVTHAKTFEGGCAARWIFSERERPVTIDLSVQAFAGNLHLAASMNGTEVYSGVLTSEPKKRTTVQARLRKGWNVLVCDTSHMQWQWQFTADLKGVDGDALEDLRYSAVPQNP
jgi:hypothetical protein